MKEDMYIYAEDSIKEALKKLNKTAKKTLFVINSKKQLMGTITDGDIRRHILKTGSISGTIEDIYNKNFIKLLKNNFTIEKAKKVMLDNKIEVIPVVDEENVVSDYLVWADLFTEERDYAHAFYKLDMPVIIMAGGKGTRLDPLTKILPKPLIPVGEKTMVEHIIDNFIKVGVSKFILTLNYKGEMIEAYFKLIRRDYEVEFVWEKEFLGTAGSLKFLEGRIKGDFIVSNCDILVKANFVEVFNFHKEKGSVFTSIASIQHYKIPYGVVNIQNGGKIRTIDEKPEYTFQVNTGVYLLNDSALKYIPTNTYFDMSELMKVLIDKGEKIFAYPVNESDYIDMGQWNEYKIAM